MDIELKELSNIYLQTFQEEDGAAGEGQNPQQSVEVGSHAKAIRYQSRRDNVPLPKAFNDYVAKNQLSGAERTALRQKLGFMESTELSEKKGCSHNHKGEECEVHGKEECPSLEPVEEEDDYKSKDKIMKKAKPLHKHLYKNLHKKDTEGDVNESSYFSWREELRELVDVPSSNPKTDEKSREKISKKKVKNKIVINPPQGMTEAIEQLGGQILEMVEIEEGDFPKDAPSIKHAKPLKKTDVKYDPHMKVMAPTVKKEEVEEVDEAAGGIIGGGMMALKALKTAKAVKGISTAAKLGSAASALAPAAKVAGAGSGAGMAAAVGAAGGYGLAKATNKKTTTTTQVEEVGSTSTNDAQVKRQLATKEQMMKKQQMLSRQRLQMQKQGKLPSGHMEELSIKDQMKISREANAKRKPYEPGDRQKQRASQIKQMAKNSSKDTRTDAQKMTDATGPRPGSRYRGD